MINSRDINDLHPTLKRGAVELQRRIKAESGWDMGINSTFRDHAKQDHLFAQGRTRPGSIVTNARGGESLHQYRLTFDIHQNNNPAGAFANANFFATAGRIWRDMGGSWGGDWASFPDRPHMEFTNGLTLRQLQNGTVMSNDIRMKWENEIQGNPVEEEVEEEEEMRFNSLEEIPTWGRKTIERLINRGFLNGDGNNLNLSEDMVRIFVINDRAGLYN